MVDRLGHLVNLVTANLAAAGMDASPAAAELVTWQLLGHLDVIMPRVETPDETDWTELLNQLQPWARELTLPAATALRDRLESLAAGYAPAAADVDLKTLRRDAHEMLASDRRRRADGWVELHRLDSDAREAVRTEVGIDMNGRGLHLPRPEPASVIRRELTAGPPVLVTGESGVGKSALVIGELTGATAADPAGYDLVCLNLRLLPPTAAELRAVLGAALDDLLAEMSAPTRIVVLDGADVVLERDSHLLAHLVRACQSAGATPWVLSATDGNSAVRAVLQDVAGTVRDVTIGGLDDAELDELARAFPQLRRIADEPRAKELLRRPAVVDLFVRSGSSGLPLSDAGAFDIVWTKLVRNDERATRGAPHARDQVMRHLATQQLEDLDAGMVFALLEPAAVSGLIHDAVLRPADRWRTLPTFAHDLLRTYAVAGVLLSADDPVSDLLRLEAPRWALPATRLAMQVMLSAPEDPQSPVAGRLARVQAAADRLRDGGHGDRWADLPVEALLTLDNAGHLLVDGWPALVAEDASGLRRLLRIVLQQHGRSLVVDRLIAEPVIRLLLDRGWPSTLHGQVHDLLSAWLRGLVLADEPAGHPLRIALRGRLAAGVAAGDERLAAMRHEEAA